jgi:NADH-quinone oxidoreductase subunit N
VVTLALVLAFTGLAFKMAAIPMHFWCPDVYEGAPTPVTAFLAVGSEAAGFALALRLFEALKIVDAELARTVAWPMVVIVLSALTMTLGNFAALWQDNLKRMLAYSSIAHAGYMLMGLAIVHGASTPWAGSGLVAYYLLAYFAMNLGAFAVVILVEGRTGSVDIGAYAGLGRRAPFLAIALTIFLFSLIGIPPTAGFAGKFQLFSGVLAEGATGGWPYYALAVIAVLNTAVSVYYYARIIKNMYLVDAPAGAGAAGGDGGALRFPVLGMALVAALLFLTFFLFFQLDLVAKATLNLRIFS